MAQTVSATGQEEEEQAAATGFDPVAFVEIPRLSDPVLSPDGKKLLFKRTAVDWSINKKVDHYQIIDVESGAIENLKQWEEKGQRLSESVWSPDSTGFLTILELKKDKKDAAYFYNIESSELQKITDHPEDINDVTWGLKGDILFFRARRHDPRSKREKALEIKEYDVSAPYELWKYDLEKARSEKVLSGRFSVRGYDLSKNGAQILYSRQPEGAQYDSHHRELWLHDLNNGTDQRLTVNGYREAQARLSPDGSRFAYIATVNERGEGYYEDNLFIQDVDSSKPRLLMPDEAMEVVDFAWGKTGKNLFILGNIGIRTELFRLDLDTDQLERLTEGDHAITGWKYFPETGRHVARITDARSPGEVYLAKGSDVSFRKLTSEYGEWPAMYRLPRQSRFQWRGRDGTALDGILVYPVDYKPGQAYPMVTITHGGPRSSSQFGSWNSSRHVPVLAAQGYAIFLPNHRGGTGYGDAFMRDMVGSYFNNAHLDVLDGIDALVTKGIADPDRLIKMGWSAGGHMTNKLITVTDRFKAASSGAGASDWISMYGESDVRHNRTPWFGGSPWQENAPIGSFTAQSMLKDAWRVKTPTLFFNGERDVRVPPTQGIMMYRGVRATGTPTKLYLAPGEPHGFRKPLHQLFKINTDLGWFARYALNKEYQPVLPSVKMRKNIEDQDCDCEKQSDPDKKPNGGGNSE
ncbi:S9 family peptidase [Sphingorhabdus sp. Alg239-R122]|uniref:S9 family peptidase n=1 Tax=Sphingorhabdus sp. Alg239-R122 TaxID=2305989 RepID=UPI0013DC8718|nr:S9 family peptidase [Sphingorhabdus sp. Alg239-R122]